MREILRIPLEMFPLGEDISIFGFGSGAKRHYCHFIVLALVGSH